MARLRRMLFIAFVLVGVLLPPAALPGEPAGTESPALRSLRTEHLHLVYVGDSYSYLVPHLVRCFRNSLDYHRALFAYEPSEDVVLILQDMDDFGYAGTTTIPHNYLTLGVEPFEHLYETCPTNERISWVMNHELLHLVAADQAVGLDRFFRRIFFGKVSATAEDPVSIFYTWLTNPRRYAPRWWHEGIAVFLETWMAGGIGRAQGGWDEMVFRTMVRDGSRFYDIVGIESEGTAKDFQTGQLSYLYGTRFVSYLALRYGPDKVLDWIRRDEGSRRTYSGQFQRVFGRTLDQEWRRWIRWEHEWQGTNLEMLRQYPLTRGRRLTRRALGSVSRPVRDSRTGLVYLGVRRPGEFAHIAALDPATGRMEKICELTSPALYDVVSLACDDSTGSVFFTSNNARRWRGLRRVDVGTGEVETLCSPTRTGDLAFDPAGRVLWGVQHHEGLARLVRFLPPYDSWQEVLTLSYRQDLFDLAVSPDGRWIVGTLVGVGGNSCLIRLEVDRLLAGDASYDILHEFPAGGPANFLFSLDGSALYGTSYQTGVSNVFRYEFASGAMDCVTNGDSGWFRPLQVSRDSLLAFEFTGDGFLPTVIADTTLTDVSALRYLGAQVAFDRPEVQTWQLGSPLTVELDSLRIVEGEYGGLGELGLDSVYPIAEDYKSRTAVGLRMDLMDPVGLHALDAACTWSPGGSLPRDEEVHARLKYRHYPWTVRAGWNRADFYDFFGPTKTARKGYSLSVGYAGCLFEEQSRSLLYNLAVAGYAGLERMPDYQNVTTTFDEFYTGRASLGYTDLRGTVGGVEAEKGIKSGVTVSATRVRGRLVPRLQVEMARGWALPWDHSSLWLWTAAGGSNGEVADPFANFYFGGFGNNWVDHASANRYRSVDSYPGLEINEAGGRNFGKAMLEWTLPPLRFHRLGVPGLYCTWARLACFGSALATNLDDGDFREEVYDAGAQLNLKLVLFSSLESTISVGWAQAMAAGRSPSEEFMASLKILR